MPCQPVWVTDDALLADLKALIEQYGWAVHQVLADPTSGAAPFSYTVGLSALGHPEVVVTGMPFEPAKAFLNMVGEGVRAGTSYEAGTRDASLTDHGDVAFIPAVDTSGLYAVEQVYGEIRAVQLVWPDSAGAYPWEPGFRNSPEVQPLLGPIPQTWVQSANE
jgi:hypothetical protein